MPMTEGWMNIRDENGNLNPLFDITFLQCKGYLAAYSDQYAGDIVKTFRGIPCNDNTIMAFMSSMNHWNLMGNPYSCAMDWSSDGIARSVVTGGAMYIWDQSLNNGSGAYRSHNGSTGVPSGTSPYIPAMNGFFVHSPSPATIMLNVQNQSILTHAPQNYYKSIPGSAPEQVRLKISKDAYSDEALILFNAEASNGFDPEKDALKLSNGVYEAPEISTLTEGNIKLCIQQLGSSPVSVPLSIDYGHSDSLLISGFDFEGLSADVGIFLEDMLTGNWQDLREDPEYGFLNEVPGTSSRFILHFTDVTHIPALSDEKSVCAYLSGSKIFVKGSLRGDFHYQLMDMGGRMLCHGKFSSCIDVSHYSTGIYILRLFSGEQTFQLKIII
jgi:hypothetical protein